MEHLGNPLRSALGAGQGLLEPCPVAEARIVSRQKLWDGAAHNAFTDLTIHAGRMLCCFREGVSHVTFDGQIRLLSSVDGKTWSSAALLVGAPGEDLRDPHFVTRPDGTLLLLGGVRTTDGETVGFHSRIWTSTDGLTWDAGTTVSDPHVWLWRASWRGDTGYSLAYSTDIADRFLRLYTSRTGASWSTGVTVLSGAPVGPYGYVNETDLMFLPNGTGLALTRRDSDGLGFPTTPLLSTALPPYENWTVRELAPRMGCPRLLQMPDGRVLVGARFYSPSRMSLAWLDWESGSVTEAVVLSSDPDCAYPGLVLMPGSSRTVWVSYYSGHDTKTTIYLTQVKLATVGGLV